LDIESDRIDIKIRDVLCKNESEVLPLFKRKSRHSNGLVFYVKGGHSITTENGREYVTAEGDLLYLPYGSSYENRVLGSGIEFYEINFEIFDNGEPTVLFDEVYILPRGWAYSFLQYFTEIYNLYRAKPHAYKVTALANLLQLLSAVLRHHDNGSAESVARGRILFALDYFKDRYYEKKSIGEIAKMGNMSISNLEKSFLAATGKTPSEYRNSLRIEYSKALLAGGFPIAEVAERVGFSDVYYFAKTFKRYTGITPGMYLRKGSALAAQP
jgi:AraC-like DNA-binding protein